MRINQFISNKSEILYDSIAMDEDKEYKVLIGNENLFFKVSEIMNNDFKKIIQKFNDNDFKEIVEKGGLKNEVPSYFRKFLSEKDYQGLDTNYYKSENHLGLRYLIKKDYLLIFTFGEKQPSRWILVLEGIWKINE